MTIRTLGSRYLLEEQIGQGGMGVVWRGRDRNAGTQYAIKLLRPEYSADPEAVTRFVRERTVLMRFRHPAVVTVHDMIVEGDQLALVMDLVRGGDLTKHARRHGGTLPPAEVARLSAQICEGLDAAHASGIVHRDLKPANVLLDDGQVRLADFGVARIVGDSSFTSSGIVLGTAAYLAPEMLTGSEPTPACDMYALGITMYEILAGRPPFTGHVAAVMHDHLDTPPARLPDVPGRLWDLVSSCLAKQPQARPTAAALAVALRDPSLVDVLTAEPAVAGSVPVTPAPLSSPVTPAPLSSPVAPAPLSSPVTPASLHSPADTAGLGATSRDMRWGRALLNAPPRILAAIGAAVVLAVAISVALLVSSSPPRQQARAAAETTVGAGLPETGPGADPSPAPSARSKATAHHRRRAGKSGQHPSLPTAVPTTPSPHSSKPGSKPSSSPGTLVAYGANLLVDGDFSDGALGAWQTTLNAAIVPGYGPGGIDAVRLTASPTAGIIEVVSGLTPGASYQVSGWGQAQGAKLFIGASDDDSENSHIIGITFTSASWRQGSTIFTLGKGQTSAKVFCVMQGGATGYCANIQLHAMHRIH